MQSVLKCWWRSVEVLVEKEVDPPLIGAALIVPQPSLLHSTRAAKLSSQ